MVQIDEAYRGDIDKIDAVVYKLREIADNEYEPIVKEISHISFPTLVNLSLSIDGLM